MPQQPTLTPAAVAAFVDGYHAYSRVPPNPAVDAALQDMLFRSWPILDPRSKDLIASLDRILNQPQSLTEQEREAANKYWTAVFGVVMGCVSVPDPETRAFRFQETIRYF